MLSVSLTPNYTGVRIQGSPADFNQLVDAFYALTIDDDDLKHGEYRQISVRVLGLCYDIRHAAMGDREVVLVDNGMTREKMKFIGQITPEQNVEYACNFLYPEMGYVMMALNELIELRMRTLTKGRYADATDKSVTWDTPIVCIRALQAAFAECMKLQLSPTNYTRWHNLMNSDHCFVRLMTHQYVDLLNIKHIAAAKDKREKALVTTVKRIAEFRASPEYLGIDIAVSEAVERHGCDPSDVRFRDIEYPDEVEW